MSAMHTRSLCAVLLVAVATAARMRITPVQTVLQQLAEMHSKAVANMEAEQKTYAEYKEWVSDRTTDLGFEIKTGESNIESLIADIEKANNKAATLGNEIADLDADINRMEAEKQDATTTREAEHAEYVTLQKDYSESVEALEKAVQVLSAQAYDRPQAEAFLTQMSSSNPGMKRALAAFLQGGQDGAPAVAAYEFQSDNIVTMLEGLLEKFKAQLEETETAESNSAHYYDLEMIHLSDTIAKSKQDREAKAASKAESAAASAKAQGDLAETKKELAADKALKAEMEATFAAKTKAYEENQQVRKDELEALSKATEILSSPEVAGSYKEHVNMAQLSAGQSSFLQLGSASRSATNKAVALLRRRATALSSSVLAKAAAQAAENPFAKVITLIEALLERLKEEAAAEADHKAWCDEQLKKNKLKRNKKEDAVEKLTAEIQELTSSIEEMAKTIATLVEEQAELAKAMQEATAQREKDKATNLDTIADAQAGSAAVKKAMVILQEFYSSQEGAAFLQQHKQVPEMEAYKGMQGRKKGVIGMLEVIETDFLRLESETQAAEEQAATEYADFMSTAQADALRKHNREEKLKLEKDQAEFEKSQLQKDLAANQKELAMANKYYEELKPACIEIHVSYEERVEKRKEEIAALKEAYSILDRKGSE